MQIIKLQNKPSETVWKIETVKTFHMATIMNFYNYNFIKNK